MSWASKRKTTRLEDGTYCLMGLFGVSMPMLYGEGHRAFRRLQEEIIRNSNDHSILAWSGEAWQAEEGLLAPSPAAFKNSGNIIQADYYPMSSMTIGLTNKGVHLLVEPAREKEAHLPVETVHERDLWEQSESDPLYMSALNCQEFGKPNRVIAICLRRDRKSVV